jgi:hypothetical protein
MPETFYVVLSAALARTAHHPQVVNRKSRERRDASRQGLTHPSVSRKAAWQRFASRNWKSQDVALGLSRLFLFIFIIIRLVVLSIYRHGIYIISPNHSK